MSFEQHYPSWQMEVGQSLNNHASGDFNTLALPSNTLDRNPSESLPYAGPLQSWSETESTSFATYSDRVVPPASQNSDYAPTQCLLNDLVGQLGENLGTKVPPFLGCGTNCVIHPSHIVQPRFLVMK